MPLKGQMSAPRISMPCAFCGTELIRRKSKAKGERQFCNRACYMAWRKANATVPFLEADAEIYCTQCGKRLETEGRRVSITGRYYCDIDCYHLWLANTTGEESPHWQGGKIKVECEQCGKVLERIPAKMDGRKHFCSIECWGNWQAAHLYGESHPRWRSEYIPCSQCGTLVQRKPYHAERFDHVFCNRQCVADWQSENRAGESNPAWRGGSISYYGPNWKRQRRKARRRDRFRCRCCNCLENGREHDVHHIVPFREFDGDWHKANRLTNLITLCSSCHKAVEWNDIVSQSELLSWVARF